MKVDFVPRDQLKKLLVNYQANLSETVIISISDTPDEQLEMIKIISSAYKELYGAEGWLYYITLQTSDDESSFNSLQAEVVRTFLDTHGTKKNYLIHCLAGVSRSGAVAKFINDYFDAGVWYLEDYRGHNKHIYNVLHANAGTNWGSYISELERLDRETMGGMQ